MVNAVDKPLSSVTIQLLASSHIPSMGANPEIYMGIIVHYKGTPEPCLDLFL